MEAMISQDSSSSSNGPLYQLSDLMAQLPIKRGLSKYYNGKSQTFTCLASAKRVQDLSKKDKRRMNPKATISKKKHSSSSSSTSSRLSTLFSSFAKTNENRSLVVVDHCFRPLLPINVLY